MAEMAPQIRSNVDGLMCELDTIAHNLANVSTPGFKRRCNAFSAVLEARQALQKNEDPKPAELHQRLDFTQGYLTKTDRALDVAIQGKGFFVIETPQGPLYTRNGMFHTNATGQLVDSEGRLIAGSSGPIVIPPNGEKVSIADDGSIQAGKIRVGRLRVADFQDNERGLIPAGSSTYKAPADVQPSEAANVTVKQGFQEASNVSMVEELVAMIGVSRLYDASMKFLTARREASQSMMDVAMG